jgi:predicted nucleotidyltransferase component of viral defense system
VDVLIDRRELLESARERNLPLGMLEKDYVLGWLLFGLTRIEGLTFKGGTALSKVYFPEIWRLSEDLDFVYVGNFERIKGSLTGVFTQIKELGGITLRLKGDYANPAYLQLKIQYEAVLGRNWIKIDVTREPPVDRVLSRRLSRVYSDYPPFRVRVESVEEICAQKIRSLVERKKSRDYYDVWQMLQMRLDRTKLRTLLVKKFEYKGIEFEEMSKVFPADLFEVLKSYWDRELGRLVYPVPELKRVVSDLRNSLAFLLG